MNEISLQSFYFVLKPKFDRLFYHECLRVFQDRLINAEDKNYFERILLEICNRNFKEVELPDQSNANEMPILFGDFMSTSSSMHTKVYEEIKNVSKAKKILQVN